MKYYVMFFFALVMVVIAAPKEIANTPFVTDKDADAAYDTAMASISTNANFIAYTNAVAIIDGDSDLKPGTKENLKKIFAGLLMQQNAVANRDKKKDASKPKESK